jgi:hypothetical protein
VPGTGRYGENPEDLPGPRRAFAEAVRSILREAAGGKTRTLRELSVTLRTPKNRLSDLVNAKVGKSQTATVYALQKLHDKASSASPKALQISINHLLQLHQAVIHLDQATQAVDLQAICATCPAAKTRDAPRSALLAADREPAGAAGRQPSRDRQLPVPPPTGDRQVAVSPDWLDMDDLDARIAAGEVADAAGILRHTGFAAAAPETAAAIAACYRRGLHEAADTMIVYAAQRPGRDVMQIAKALLDDDHPSGASELLELTLAL